MTTLYFLVALTEVVLCGISSPTTGKMLCLLPTSLCTYYITQTKANFLQQEQTEKFLGGVLLIWSLFVFWMGQTKRALSLLQLCKMENNLSVLVEIKKSKCGTMMMEWLQKLELVILDQFKVLPFHQTTRTLSV